MAKASMEKSAFDRLMSAARHAAEAVESGDPASHPGVRVTVRDARDVRVAPPPDFDADRVRRLRTERLRLSQRAFAEVVGFAPVTVMKWEQSRIKVNKTAARLMHLLETAPAATTRRIITDKPRAAAKTTADA